MAYIWRKVLEPTVIDGRDITKDWIMRYGPTLKGKPANIDSRGCEGSSH